MNGTRVLVAAGGTGGHMTPALAVAEELTERGALVSFATTPSQVERVAARFAVYPLEMRGFERRPFSRRNLTAVYRLALAAPRSWAIVSHTRPHVAVGGGGYLSGPVIAAAAARGVPSLAIENDAHLGVANRLLKPMVERLCLSFPIDGLGPPKCIVTGRPLSDDQLRADADAGRRFLGLRPDLPMVLAFGGSQGAQSINRACVAAFAGKAMDFQLVHVCGPRHYEALAAELAARGAGDDRYRLLDYTERLGDLMAAADLVVGRSGGSVAEVAALGRPAVLVPYPHASADHQRKNAEWMARAGAAVVVDDAQLDGERLGALVRELLADRDRLSQMAAASASLGRRDATIRVADEVERLSGRKTR